MARQRTALDKFIDPDTIDAYLAGDPDIVQGKIELANMAADFARSIAPVDTQAFQDGIVVRRSGATGVGLHFTDPDSGVIEYGTEDTPEFAVMRRTIEHFGGTGS